MTDTKTGQAGGGEKVKVTQEAAPNEEEEEDEDSTVEVWVKVTSHRGTSSTDVICTYPSIILKGMSRSRSVLTMVPIAQM